MAFNPEEAAKSLGLQDNIQVGGSAAQFDHTKAAAALGLDIPEPKMPAASPNPIADLANKGGEVFDKYSQNYGQGAALGYGSQLNAGLQSAAGAVDQAINGQNSFGNQSAPDADFSTRALDAISNLGANYTRAKKSVDEKIAKTRASDPWKSALTEIAGSIAPSIVASKGLDTLGITGLGQAGTLGTLYSYGSSQKEGLDRALEGAEGGVKAMLAAKAFQLAGKGLSALKNADYGKYLEAEYGDYSKPLEAVKDMTASASKEAPYALDYKTKFGEPFKLGSEMGKALTNPNVQAQISQELNNQPKIASEIIASTKDRLGTLKDALKAEHGNTEVDAAPTIKKIYSFIDNMKVGSSDAERLAAKADLRNAVTTMEDALISKDPITNVVSKAKLGDLMDAQNSFGRDVFDSKTYSKDPVVNGAAKKVWGMLTDSINKADETASGGQISTINKVFKSMYDMEDNMISGTTIKSLTDPQAVGADNKFSEFVRPFEELPANVRDTLAPEMHDFLANQFPKVFSKAKIMLLATERGAQAAQANKGILSLAGLRNLQKAISANVQNKAGVYSNIPGRALGAMSGALQNPQLSNSMQAAAPALGSLLPPKDKSAGALKEIK